MLLFLIKRVLWFVPTLIAVTLIGFILLKNSPGDPAEQLLRSTGSSGTIKTSMDIEIQKNAIRHRLGLDLPIFYFSISKLSEASNNSTIKNYIPAFNWHGFHNQYHHWLFGGSNSKGVIRGDFGISFIKNEPITSILKDKLIWSLFFSILSIILAYTVSIPIGIKMAARPNAIVTKTTQTFFFIMYSLPSFFVGVLLLMLFANPDVISIFPPSGIKPIGGYQNDSNLFEKFMDSLPYIILPLICYTYSSLAFISRLTATAVSEQLPLDYVKTARAKGLSEKTILWKHALKNSLVPLITVFSAVFPTIIRGTVIIESIFTIPGVGLETIRAINSHDYPLVVAIVTLTAILTIFSYLIADILYALVDPRIRK